MEHQILTSALEADTLKGLTSKSKFLLSKYFYDDKGSSIFQDIMQMPEYYLTDCEFEIFNTHKKQIASLFMQGDEVFDLIELGSGDGLKTKVLLQYLVENAADFNYIPIDISHKANMDLVKSLKKDLPLLNVNAKTGDYFQEIKKLNGSSRSRKIFLFLGSNIGNFSDVEMDVFFNKLSKLCQENDKLLVGFDLKKSPDVILQAYDDPHGHTKRFNLNHLLRLNRELGAAFIPENFEHLAEYDPQTGAAKSFLVSRVKQSVHIQALEQSISFEKGECIFMERSRKFDQNTIEKIANEHGFRVEYQFKDKRNYFVNSLWVKESK